ncbi:reverse transcriptase domain-containing protein [Acinetobacter nosocomialis]|uniref:reverse transcriptase domain-containing protein n=1 Tax=Acinetobacter nosocomialis TaxID=106654 RepID=UPI001250B412|nr:reverse transcriptase domain-containing protein [Acinetobacter nosocomialis]MBP1482922.1 RNA-directed DNA polymerase [Acinetobacter nosocomialis]
MNILKFPISKLALASDKKDLSNLLNYDYKDFCWILYSQPIHMRYKLIEIPKKNGKIRIIHAPDSHLKQLQKNLAIQLNKIFEEKNLYEPAFSFAFRRNNNKQKFGIYFNAKRHRNRKLVINIDLKDFFHTIEFKRIVGYFKRNKYFNFPIDVAIGIAQIACYKDPNTGKTFLPQGSPVSPIISNLITEILDAKFTKLAKKYKFYYSRYADDLTLSFDTNNIPSEIVKCNENNYSLGREVIKAIKSSGFNINKDKVSFRTNFDRQQVTGLVVNKKINIPRNYYDFSKSMAYNYCQYATFKKSSYHTFAKKNSNQGESIIGVLNYIYNIKMEYKNRTTDKPPYIYTEFKIDKPKSPEQLFWSKNSFIRLLLQTYFQESFVYRKKIHLLCEGKTDPLHFKNYISTLPIEIQSYYDFTAFKEEDLTIFQKELNIRSGTPNLKRFIEIYSTLYISKMIFVNPTILIVDNDKAGNEVFQCATGRYKKTTKNGKVIINSIEIEYAYICKNLFIIKLPKINPETTIEDLYDTTLTSTILNGKSFTKDNVYDPNIHYGKVDFFKNVIRKNRTTIDYKNFEAIIEIINRIFNLNFYLNLTNIN